MMHIADRDGKDTTVRFVPLRPLPNPERAVSGRPVRMARFMVATDDTTHQHLMTQHGTDYGAALVESDPEIDLETLGRPVGSTNTVFVNQHGEPLRVIPEMVELVLDPSGNERERREPINLSANIQEEEPIRLSKVRIKRAEAIRRFAFPRRITLTHVDGLTYQFLFDLAADLDQADEMAMVGAGPKGRDPLVFQEGGQPWRGFLAGRVTDNRYSLVLHLSNLELRTPEEVAHGA
jgi:hypothetical protein